MVMTDFGELCSGDKPVHRNGDGVSITNDVGFCIPVMLCFDGSPVEVRECFDSVKVNESDFSLRKRNHSVRKFRQWKG